MTGSVRRLSSIYRRSYRFRLARGRSGQYARGIGRRAGVAVAAVIIAVCIGAVVGGAAAGADGSTGWFVDTGRRDRRSRGRRLARRYGLRLRSPTVARSVTRRSSHNWMAQCMYVRGNPANYFGRFSKDFKKSVD